MFEKMNDYSLCRYMRTHTLIKVGAGTEDFSRAMGILCSTYREYSVTMLRDLTLDLYNYVPASAPLIQRISLLMTCCVDVFFTDLGANYQAIDSAQQNLPDKVEKMNHFLRLHQTEIKGIWSNFEKHMITPSSKTEEDRKIQTIFKNNLNTYFKQFELIDNQNIHFSLYRFGRSFTFALLECLERGANAYFPIYKIVCPLISFAVKEILVKIYNFIYLFFERFISF